MRAAAWLRRPDFVRRELNRRGTFLASRIALPESLRAEPEGLSATLPGVMLLLLDHANTLRLFEAARRMRGLELGEQLLEWGAGTGGVKVLPGRGNFRAVEIGAEGNRVLVAVQWRSSGQRPALELMERETSP